MNEQNPERSSLSNPSDVEVITGDTNTRRRGFLRRKEIGQQTINVMSDEAKVFATPEEWEDEEDYFGLREDIVKYQELWGNHRAGVRLFVETHRELMTEAVDSLVAVELDQTVLGKSSTLQEEDLETLVSIFDTGGKATEFYTSTIDIKNGGIKRALHDVKNTVFDTLIKKIKPKQDSLLGQQHQTKEIVRLHKDMKALWRQSHGSYGSIIDQENKILYAVYKRVMNNPHEAIKFLNTFTDISGSELTTDKTFVAIFANDRYESQNSKEDVSLIDIALESIEPAGDSGELASEFIDFSMAENGGDNTLAYFTSIVAKITGEKNSLANELAQNYGTWPLELQLSYKAYVKSIKESLKRDTSRACNDDARQRGWLHPDLRVYERTIDVLYRKLYKGNSNSPSARPKRATTSKSNGNYMTEYDIFDNKQEEDSAPRQLAILRRLNKDYISENVDSVDLLLESLVDTKQMTPSYREGLTKVINSLTNNPFGLGSKKVKSIRSRNVDNQPKKIYTANPTKITGLSLPEEVKNTRLIFAIGRERQLSIHAIIPTHDEYDRVLAGIS